MNYRFPGFLCNFKIVFKHLNLKKCITYCVLKRIFRFAPRDWFISRIYKIAIPKFHQSFSFECMPCGGL